MQRSEIVQIRDYRPEDRNFILSTWLKGLRYGNDWFEAIPSDIYFSFYHNVIETLLNRPSITIKVACLKEDNEVILAYAVYEGSRLDWVFCKKAFRSIGIAKSLVPIEVSTVSHLTALGKSILRKRPNVHFNPFSLS